MKLRFKNLLPVFFLYLGLVIYSSAAYGGVTNLHHDMQVELDPAAGSLHISDHVRLQGSGEASFRLAENMIITGIRVDGKIVAQSRRGGALKLNLGDEGNHRIEIDYRGILSSFPNQPRTLEGAPLIVSPEGSYLSPGAAWHLMAEGVSATYQVKLILPDAQKAVVPGSLVQESSSAGMYQAVFKSDIPTHGIILIAGPFIVNERRHKDVVLRTYFPLELEKLSSGYLDSTAQYIDLFSERIGDYPFPSFNIVSGPLPVGLGFPGMTYIGERVLQLPFIRFTSLGHEVLHNWWGNGVEVKYSQGNWAEGLTTYMTDYALAGIRGKENTLRMRTEWLRDYAALPPRRDQAVRNFVSRSHDASQIIGYNKVAFIFHMLERRLGKIKFREGIQAFWTKYKFRSAGWVDIKEIFEDISGMDLSVFFEQWVDRSGAPKIQLSNIQQVANKLTFVLSQPDLPYSLNVPIRLKTKTGEEIFQASIDGNASKIELPLPSPPVSLSVDPDFDIFRRLDATEAPPILRDTTLNADTMVIFAGSDKIMEKVAKNLATKLMDGPPHFANPSKVATHGGPLLIFGQTLAVQELLHSANLRTTPKMLLGRGTARVWASRQQNSNGNLRPILVVEAEDQKAMQSLIRPLPHYGRRGYLIFEGRSVLEDGVWPTKTGPLSVVFD